MTHWTGTPRQITLTNTGLVDAPNVVVGTSGLPPDTVVTPSSCGTIAANGGTCVITVTPGATASSNAVNTPCTSGVQPAGSVNIIVNGGLTIPIATYVLSYGCVYQGGFLYAVDDTTSNTSSIGGKAVTLVDQAAPEISSGPQSTSIVWSSNGNSAVDADETVILGIDETSTTSIPSPTTPAYPPGTPAYRPCNGSSDGACDASNIISYYNFNRVSGGSAPTPLTYYAAGLCASSINGYSDWYLPAICEMDAANPGVTCPGTQSILSSLPFLIGDPSAPIPSTSCNPPIGTTCLAGNYWSSTEDSNNPLSFAWIEEFYSGSNIRYPFLKFFLFGARCSRVLTP